MPGPKSIPLAMQRKRHDASPFSGDLCERKGTADRLTDLVNRLPEGGVIAIDAGWGEGKSWFARNWNASLKKQGVRTIYLDAFESDYVEDPFLLVTAELMSTLDSESNEAGRE